MIKKGFVIIIDGPMGSGKTTISKDLHKKLKNTALISLDSLKRLISDYKPDNPKHLELSSNIGGAMAREYLTQGYNVIIEKAFTQEKYLKGFIKNIKFKGKIFVYQLEAPIDIRLRRIGQRSKEMSLKGDYKKPTKRENKKKY